MTKIKVHHYDAFSNTPNKGNPAGVVLDANDLTELEMQDIAQQVGFNETAFALSSDSADIKIRYFTPGQEMNLCGHATMATLYALKSVGQLPDKKDFRIETKAGILTIQLEVNAAQNIDITMQQATPEFKPFTGSTTDLATVLNITEADVIDDLPIVYGSTGLWTLIVPVKSLSVIQQMIPQTAQFPDVVTEMPKVSIHPLCFETYDAKADMHGRHFSSPYSGTVEDPVTGTASGVMGAYYAKFVDQESQDTYQFVVEQGQEIDKDGRVLVNIKISDNHYDVQITGIAVYVDTMEITLN
ncbi:PhzF family phenazine biosynthesis isomerase [Staphylococcus gallinarum]|uniref:PhzF family phenazine biosynthesis isomerase n=1 Tax=Staphylococcus gallinarum TaxID=1293 RepID=UPI001E4D5937|nr:PhzF family phenazine biosynthesis isomerase [Staphylococcus gallinarum]MCD8793460.1 PhzF family phenazine biosynthesis isomerase [Staphylococcus gallinarum]MCD8871604.1 PhzF family phenazine biosynthesis isomerase [Staphylococcus gallinarum]MCW0986160.1 PhzF family phenazine biosynthesis isomerase [Staphylococcus gallinarum]MDN6414054.1 PhzF family phenazine biosynthesis isomerase [Staphylococcus gallinarum]